MSQDETQGIARAFADVAGKELRDRERLAQLEQERREHDLLLAAIVTQHGEALGNGRYRLSVDAAHLETAEARRLSLVMDPVSGAVLLRVQPL